MAIEIIEHESLAEALLHAQSEYTPLEKNKTVEVRKEGKLLYTYEYADLAHTKKMTDPLLWKHGLVVNGKTEYRDGKEFQVDVLKHVHSKEEDRSEIEITESDMKLFGGNSTYAKRYNYCNLTGRVGEDDSEPRPSSNRGRNKSQERKNAPNKPDEDKEGTSGGSKGGGSAEGGMKEPSGDNVGDIKNDLIALESRKKADGATKTMIDDLRKKVLGNLTLDHAKDKLIAYGDALSKLGSLDPGNLEEDARTKEED